MTYTISTDPSQEALLSWIVAQWNKEHDTQLSNQQYVTARFPNLLQPYLALYENSLESSIQKSFLSADPTTQAQIKSLLKITI